MTRRRRLSPPSTALPVASSAAKEELRSLLVPLLGRELDDPEVGEMAANVLAVERILARWRERRGQGT